MPIKVVRDTITGSLARLGPAIAEAVEHGALASSINATSEMRTRASHDEFWTNRSGNALRSIAGEVETDRRFVSVAVGFEAGKPNEIDAPDYYKSGRSREYAEYIADREAPVFLASALQSIIRNITIAMDNMGHKIGNMQTSRASYSRKGQ